MDLHKLSAREKCSTRTGDLLLLLAIGGFFSLFPDISAVWNLLVYGKLGGHCMIGSFPTHSLLFSVIAIISGFLIGMLVYKQQNKALALGLFSTGYHAVPPAVR